MLLQETLSSLTITTVTSRDYLPGTMVMLHSFAATNPWFCGEIVIFQDDLTEADKRSLDTVFGKVSFPDIDPELLCAIQQLCNSRSHLARRQRQFYSLGAFRPAGSTPTLFCDSDLLFLEDISAFLDTDAPLIACGDRAQMEGNSRDPETHLETPGPSGNSFNSFNAGLMLIRPGARTASHWSDIIGQLDPNRWDTIKTSHTDQAVLNRIFGRDVLIADPAFNFLLGHAQSLRETANISLTGAKVIHFINDTKPWRTDQHLSAVRKDASLVKAFRLWFESYTRMLVNYHFKTANTE